MSLRRRPGRRLLLALLPVALLLVLGLGGGLLYLVRTIAQPETHPYLVTPETFPASARGLKVTEETWSNPDGSQARGWLLRGAEGAPAVVLLHRYGADRSWLLNLGVKINEAKNYTILWPDLRGHGANPSISHTTFGTREASDVTAAVAYLRNLKTSSGQPLTAERFGFYGVELGAYAALAASSRSPESASVRALVLDSVPTAPDQLLRNSIRDRIGFDNGLLGLFTGAAARIYFLGGYSNDASCDRAAQLSVQRVLLLSGADAGNLRDSTSALASCFPATTYVSQQTDLPLTGFTASSATGEQGDNYDRLVIEFFSQAFRENSQSGQ